MQISFITAKTTSSVNYLPSLVSILQVKHFLTIIHNLPESIFKASCIFASCPKQGRLPEGRLCLSETVLLTPQRQHGTLARMEGYELKLWPWHHLGDHSYAVSTFSKPPPPPPPRHLCCAAAPRTLTSGYPPPGLGGRCMHAGQGEASPKHHRGTGGKVLG